jgi:molybdopterin synthase catalytic subunit
MSLQCGTQAVKEGDELAFFPPVSGGEETRFSHVIQITRSPIQIEPLVNQLRQPEDGAVVVFDGIVRNHSRGRKTLHLEYEGYEPMALKKMEEIETSARSRWPVNRIGIVHRLGRLEIGEGQCRYRRHRRLTARPLLKLVSTSSTP